MTSIPRARLHGLDGLKIMNDMMRNDATKGLNWTDCVKTHGVDYHSIKH